jgi:cell division septation protein DedD
VVYNVADNAAGKLRVTFTQVAPKAPADGNGGLISFDLKATGGGDPKLKVSAALLARNDGSPQPVTVPSSGGTPVQPQGSPVANPTQIPGGSGNSASASSQASTTTPLAQQGTTPAANATPGGVITSAPAHANDGDAMNWTPAWIAAGVAALVAAAVAVGWRYKQRNGESK